MSDPARTKWGLYSPNNALIFTCKAISKQGAILFMTGLPMHIRRGVIPNDYNVHAVR